MKVINIDIDFLRSLMTLASGESYEAGRLGTFIDDDIDNSKYHKWIKERIDSLIDAAMVKEIDIKGGYR